MCSRKDAESLSLTCGFRRRKQREEVKFARRAQCSQRMNLKAWLAKGKLPEKNV